MYIEWYTSVNVLYVFFVYFVYCQGLYVDILSCSVATNASDTTHGSLRLVDGNSSSGVLEMSLDGRWWTVCSFLFSTAAATVACRQLELPSGVVKYTSGKLVVTLLVDLLTVV